MGDFARKNNLERLARISTQIEVRKQVVCFHREKLEKVRLKARFMNSYNFYSSSRITLKNFQLIGLVAVLALPFAIANKATSQIPPNLPTQQQLQQLAPTLQRVNPVELLPTRNYTLPQNDAVQRFEQEQREGRQERREELLDVEQTLEQGQSLEEAEEIREQQRK